MEEEKKHSLWALQNMLMEAEEEGNHGDLEKIIGQIADKIDALKEVVDMLECESDRFKRYKDEMAARQKSLTNAANRIKAYVIKCLEERGTEFEVGNVWAVKLRQTKAVEILVEPDLNTYLKLSEINPMQSFIKQSFSFDKREIATALKNGEQNIGEIAQLVTNKSLTFATINKAKR